MSKGNGRKKGQPTKYKPEFTEQVKMLCFLGATDEQLAIFFKVCELTINNWKKDHPDFFESIKNAKLDADHQIGKSLFQRALGYEHPEERVFCSEGEITTHQTTKHYPPDTQAIRLWLLNRQPKEWRDPSQLEVTGPDGGPIQSQYVINPVKPKELTDAKEKE